MNLALHCFRKLVVVLCLLAVLISALTPAISGGLLFAILIPLWLLLLLSPFQSELVMNISTYRYFLIFRSSRLGHLPHDKSYLTLR